QRWCTRCRRAYDTARRQAATGLGGLLESESEVTIRPGLGVTIHERPAASSPPPTPFAALPALPAPVRAEPTEFQMALVDELMARIRDLVDARLHPLAENAMQELVTAAVEHALANAERLPLPPVPPVLLSEWLTHPTPEPYFLVGTVLVVVA